MRGLVFVFFLAMQLLPLRAAQHREWVIHTPPLTENTVYRIQQSLQSQSGLSLVGYVRAGSFLLIRSAGEEWSAERILRLCDALSGHSSSCALVQGCTFYEIADGQNGSVAALQTD
ncbi:MAG: hypothetical protein ACKOQY_00765 [Bacteroidota bacterium]